MSMTGSVGLALRLTVVTVTAFLMLTMPSTAMAAAKSVDSDHAVFVTGVGTVAARPDSLRFTVGVEVEAQTVSGALTAANEAAGRVHQALREHGVADADLQTAGISVHPQHDDAQRVTGYVVKESVRVLLRSLDDAGTTIDAAVRAGGNASRLYGFAFELQDDRELLKAARDIAFASARSKAEQYAALSGRSLGDVTSIRETSQESTSPVLFDDEAFLSVPIEPGSITVTVVVEVAWELR